jgi:hypothetical protein
MHYYFIWEIPITLPALSFHFVFQVSVRPCCLEEKNSTTKNDLKVLFIWSVKVKVKLSRYRPGQALGVPAV